MRIIGVIDLKGGAAVHARGGDRAHYQPIATAAGRPIAGNPLALAAMYRELHAIDELYVADLDAIAGLAPQDAAIDALVATGAPLWLDAAISTWQAAQAAINRGVACVVVGLETLTSFEALDVICISVGGQRVAFSLDLRDGAPLVTPGAELAGRDPAALAARGARAGVGALIVLDLARVGRASGVDLDLIRRVREAAPSVTLVAGGGLRGDSDVTQLADAGCDAALAATMLHSVRR